MASLDTNHIKPNLNKRLLLNEVVLKKVKEEKHGCVKTVVSHRLLEETLANNSPWSTEERNRLFAAVAESSYANAQIAMNFISSRTDAIRRS